MKRNVDFRSPARYGSHYMVIDYDGTLYPTDEARMLSRTRHVDLSLGNLETAFDTEKSHELNQSAVHQVHHDRIHRVQALWDRYCRRPQPRADRFL